MSNLNFLSPVEFRFVIARLPNVRYNVQSVTLPGISSGVTSIPTPFKPISRPGDSLSYDELILEVIVDEEMRAFTETWDWLVGLTSPQSFDQYRSVAESEDGLFSDATLTILNSSKNPGVEVQFENLFPISVGSIQLDTKATDVNPPTSSITFRYSNYKINPIS
jgi:hypothetical protein